MAINFPDAPTTGDTHTVGDKTWTYDGTAWNVVVGVSSSHGDIAGLADDDHTQYLLADGTRTATELTVTNNLTVDTDTLHVDSTNNRVGIGTTSPSEPLTISTAGSSITADGVEVITTATDSNPYVKLTNDARSYSIQLKGVINDNFAIRDQTAAADRLSIDSSGNVGIGTTSPDNKLHVQIGASAAPSSVPTSHMIIADSGEATDSGMAVYSSTTGNGYLRFGDSDNAAQAGFRYQHSADKMYFRTGGTDRGAIDSSGNVGIGTTAPSTNLHISSGTSGDAELRIEADTDNNNEADLPSISLAADGGILEGVIALDNNVLRIVSNVTTDGGISFCTGATNVYTNATDVVTATSERMRIDSSGRVTMPNQPAFEVTRTGSGFTSGQYLPYNVVEHDNAGGWSTSTYRYTIPVSGTWLFYWTNIGQANSGTVHRYYFRVNGVDELVEAQLRLDQTGENASKYTQASQQRIVPLSANDYVQIWYVADNGGASYGNVAYTRLGGYLLG